MNVEGVVMGNQRYGKGGLAAKVLKNDFSQRQLLCYKQEIIPDKRKLTLDDMIDEITWMR